MRLPPSTPLRVPDRYSRYPSKMPASQGRRRLVSKSTTYHRQAAFSVPSHQYIQQGSQHLAAIKPCSQRHNHQRSSSTHDFYPLTVATARNRNRINCTRQKALIHIAHIGSGKKHPKTHQTWPSTSSANNSLTMNQSHFLYFWTACLARKVDLSYSSMIM